MKDSGIDKGLVSKFETSSPLAKGKFGWRKMFWDYLKSLNVPFFDPCCEDAATPFLQPVAWDSDLDRLVRFDGTDWVAINVNSLITTTTTSSTTTTTTTP